MSPVLAGRDGIVITHHWPPAGAPYITLSEPLPELTLTSDEFLHSAAHDDGNLLGLYLTGPNLASPDVLLHTAAHLAGEADCPPSGCPCHTCWHGWYLHLDAANVHAVYRIGDYSPHHPANTWEMTRWNH